MSTKYLREKVIREAKAYYEEKAPELKAPAGQEKSQTLALSSLVEENTVEIYTRMRAGGITHEESLAGTMSILNIPAVTVMKTLKRNDLKGKADALFENVKEAVFEDKVPILKDIIGLTLNQVKDSLEYLSQDEERKARLSPRDIRDLTGIARELNDLLRLELGQSTVNIQSTTQTHQSVHVILDDLRKIDPVFEYPELTIEHTKEQ